MFADRLQFGLPLFARELTEQAKRPRTYVLRTLYAGFLFGLAYVRFHDILRYDDGSGFAILGHGRRMFDALVTLQVGGIYLFMPAVGCSAVTSEKERNTLSLLFLTRLGPWTILLEKLLSRLAPMMLFLLLAMPLLAFTYSLGGVTQLQFWGSIWILALTAAQVASVTIMFSAYCTSTVSAFVGSYAGALATFIFCGCCSLLMAIDAGVGGLSIKNGTQLVVSSLGGLFTTALFLVLARNYLTSRAFVERGSLLAESLRRYDRFRVAVSGTTGEIMLVRHVQSLPDEEPVAWRENIKSSLGSAGNLVRIVASIEIPLLLMLPAVLSSSDLGEPGFASFVIALLWLISVLILVVRTSGLIHRERDRQTLDLLLTTPMSGAEILRQKLSSLWRLLPVLWIPFATLLAVRVAWAARNGWTDEDALYVFVSVVSVLVYPPLVVWFSMWTSLHVKSQGRAILLALAVLCGWTFLPLLVDPIPFPGSGLRVVSMISPAFVLASNEIGEMSGLGMVVHFVGVVYGMLAFRELCLVRADDRLRRATGDPHGG